MASALKHAQTNRCSQFSLFPLLNVVRKTRRIDAHVVMKSIKRVKVSINRYIVTIFFQYSMYSCSFNETYRVQLSRTYARSTVRIKLTTVATISSCWVIHNNSFLIRFANYLSKFLRWSLIIFYNLEYSYSVLYLQRIGRHILRL